MIYEVLTKTIGLNETKLPSSKITWLKEQTQRFHIELVDSYTPSMSSEKFNNFRRAYLNKIREEYSDIFYDDKLAHILINLLQVCLILRDDLDIENYADNYFDYFFSAASMLVVKFETPFALNKVITRACESGLQLKTLFETEKLIMNKLAWKLHLTTPIDIIRVVLMETFSNDELKSIEELQGNMSDWVNFSMNEYELYGKYNQFIISLACVIISLNSVAGMEGHLNKIIKMINLNFAQDKEDIQNCISIVTEIMNREDGEEEEHQSTNADELTMDVENNYDGSSDKENTSPNTPPKTRKRRIKSISGNKRKKSANKNSNDTVKQLKVSDFCKNKKNCKAEKIKKLFN